ncbi:MAG TPA: PTS transporter subunit EIIB [Acholeplasmataceae bacterium]|nr:PTS transporter subunit EIIB [Acholeplasmataceae bacterium]
MIYLAIENALLYLILVPIAIIFILIIVAFVLRIKKYNQLKKVSEEVVDSFQQKEFLDIYGGQDNIINVNHEMSRITVEVRSVEKVNLEKLQEFGAKGVLVTGNTVKASFGDRAQYIYKLLK